MGELMVRAFAAACLACLFASFAVSSAMALNQTQLRNGLGIPDTLNPAELPEGGAKVIVELADIATAQTLTARTLGRLQEAAILQLGLGAVDDLVQFKHSPILAFTATPKILFGLLDSPLVKSVSIDQPLVTGLSQSGPLVGADAAHQEGLDGAGVSIAVLDTGTDAGHRAFGGRVVAEACFASNGRYNGNEVNSPCPGAKRSASGKGTGAPCTAAGCDHGTHVAAIAAGENGVAPKADIVAVQVFSIIRGSACGRAERCVTAYMSDVMRALEWVYDQRDTHKVAAVNLSLGGGRYKDACDGEAVARTVRLLTRAGIAVVSASGNESYADSVAMPGCVSLAFTVAATDKRDGVSSFSNSDGVLDLWAPGAGIRAAVPGGGTQTKSGTSMAAPHVAGAFAALKARYPDADLPGLEALLRAHGPTIRDRRNGIERNRLDLQGAAIAAHDKWGDGSARKPGADKPKGGLLDVVPGLGGLLGGGRK